MKISLVNCCNTMHHNKILPNMHMISYGNKRVQLYLKLHQWSTMKYLHFQNTRQSSKLFIICYLTNVKHTMHLPPGMFCSRQNMQSTFVFYSTTGALFEESFLSYCSFSWISLITFLSMRPARKISIFGQCLQENKSAWSLH